MAGVSGLCGQRIGSASLEITASYVLRYQVGWVRMIVLRRSLNFLVQRL
jgi:hypothetical protein